MKILQTLNGTQALTYSRIRNLDIDGDFSRTARQRKLLEDLFFNGYSQKELADKEDIRENSMSDRKKRALASLKKILEKK